MKYILRRPVSLCTPRRSRKPTSSVEIYQKTYQNHITNCLVPDISSLYINDSIRIWTHLVFIFSRDHFVSMRLTNDRRRYNVTSSLIDWAHIQMIHILWSILRWWIRRDHSGYGPSQWETTLQCNVVSHWLSPYTEWSPDTISPKLYLSLGTVTFSGRTTTGHAK